MITRVLAIAIIGGAVAAAQGDDTRLPVCVGTDGVVRARTGTTCPAGGKKYTLFVVPDAARGTGFSVVAPFEVTDQRGKTLLRVSQNPEHQGGGMSLFSSTGVEVATIAAAAEGGFFKARSKSTYPEVALGTVGTYGGLVIRDAPGQFRASIFLENGTPGISLRGASYVPFAVITAGSSGGGLLELADPAGNAQMRAGITDGGCGRVETFPERPPSHRVVGAPSSFIVGNCK